MHISTKYKIFSLFLLLTLGFLPSWAVEGDWSEHTEGITPAGHLYEVHTAEQLAWVAQQVNSGVTTFAGKTVSMRADVDLSAHNWQPIGQNVQYTFAGTFEGNAHVISGMTIDETYTEYYPVDNGLSAPGYGLFGSINGGTDYAGHAVVVRNVVLENPSITLHVAGENKFTRVGLLAGSAGVRTTIRNCNILGGKILIDGVPEQDGGTRFFVGGAIGGSAHGFAGAYTESNHYSLLLQKIVVDADITITPASAYVPGHQHTQNNVGGIIGRLRYGYQAFEQVLYTGTIDARQFTVSPSFGAWCNAPNGSNDRDLTKENYTGDVVGDWFNNMTSVYFTTYNIKHGEETTAVTADNLTSGTTTTGTRSLRTLSTLYTGDTQDMYAFQGVNAGTYTADASTLVSNFNSGLSSDRYEWEADGSRLKLHRKDDIQLGVNGQELTVSFINGQPTDATNVTYTWTKNGMAHSETTNRVNMPANILAPITWEVHVSYVLNGNTYYTNTCSYTQEGTIVAMPTISLAGATSGNTLTLTATLDRKGLTLNDEIYHWQKDSDKETEQNAYTKAVTALTHTPAEWRVYATFTHNGIPYRTESAAYTQLPPVVTLTPTTDGNVLTVTPSMDNYGGAITNIHFYRVTYTEGPEGERADTAAVEYNSATETGFAFSFEEQPWYVLAKYMVGSREYISPIAEYTHPAAVFPELTISEENNTTLTANLVPNEVITGNHSTSLTYTWTRDGQSVAGNTSTQTISHSFADQVWTAVVNMTVNARDYVTNLFTYTVQSTLGDVKPIITVNGDELSASLDKALASGITVTYTWRSNLGNGFTGPTYTKRSGDEWVELTATIKQGANVLTRYAYHQFSEYNVVYINYTGGGKDSNTGRTKDQPVATWKKAYSLLTPGVGWDKNIIVITSTSGSANMFIKNEDTEGKRATITGEWPWEGTKVVTGGRVIVNANHAANSTHTRIGAPTRFKNVTIWGPGSSQGRMSLYLHDTEFDTGVVMKNFADLDASSGAVANRIAPHFHLQLYSDQLNSGTFSQHKDSVMKLTIKSGQFGRILSSRIAGTKAISTYIIGRHDNPLKANITIDIQDLENNRKAGGKTYTDDIAYLAAGLTQGMMWGDVTINVKRGSIATLVAGSQGNGLSMGSLNVPVSTFCGRTTINICAEQNSDVYIQRYFGGCQGRVYNSSDPYTCNAYFYGKSTLNITGGTVVSDIFASSAGISGLRSADPDYYAKGWYTDDQRIPYEGTYAYGVDYLPYNRSKQIVTMTTHDGTIDLSDTEIKINIAGGEVNNVYGGSHGYSDVLPYNVAPKHAGRLFGNTSVTISGGTITGNVYGGGKGSTEYYRSQQVAYFADVAQVYGNTNVTITGGDIRGNIYAGGGGVASGTIEFLDIAKVYGNTNLTINCPSWTKDAPFRGNIYGGGALAAVDGSTSMHIENGAILGNIYAGGEGEDGHPAKACVIGHTFVDLGDQVSRDIEEVDVEVFGDVYGGGKLAQVVTPADKLSDYLIRDSELGTLFSKEHTYTTHVRLGVNSHVYGQVFGGGEGKQGDEQAGLVVGQTDVALDGAVTWAEIYGGGRMADVQGNTLVHFKKGRAGHNAFGGGLGLLDGTDATPDNERTVLASADVQRIPDFSDVPTGNTFVVFDGTESEHTTYEFKKARTFRVENNKPVIIETDQYHPELHASRLFSIDHNIYGGGQTAADVAGNTYVHIRYGMVDSDMLNYEVGGKKVWNTIYNSIANPQFCVFGGGYGYHSDVEHDSYVTMDIFGSGNYRYIGEFTLSFVSLKEKWHWDTNVGTRENIYGAADEATWSHGAPGRSAMDIIGGGYNGKVKGTAHVSAAGDIVVRKVYGGGYYASVGNTDVTLNAGIFDRVYGGGMIGNVEGIARLTVGQQAIDYTAKQENMHLMVKDAVYGGNDVSGTVGYNTTNGQPIDDAEHGVRLNLNGGLILGDVYGAGNGHHPGYTNPDYVDFNRSQHPSDNYTILPNPGTTGKTAVYKYRPRVGRVVMNLHGNEGENFNDNPQIDKLRIWGRTFGGGNSCNVGIWDNSGFQGGGTITLNIGSHVQLGNGDDSHDEPNGLFMGSNGDHMVTQHDAEGMQKYYHHYWDGAKYTRGFASGNEAEFTKFVNTIQTWSDNVSLNVANGATDVWMTNFVGGGFRGSMRAKTASGHFHYTLPRGVTVGHSVVGGAFNAHVTYTENTDTIYTYNGGMMAEDGGERKHVIKGGGADFTSPETGYANRKDNALVKLELHNMLMPVVHPATATTPENVHGGIVYGGCFKSGFVDGDTWVDYHCSLSPLCTNAHYFNAESQVLYDEVADMEKNNALLVFGAGYGEDTHSMGDVYLRVISEGREEMGKNVNYPFIYNVFGGSNLGEVSGSTNVYYDGGKHGALFGSLYGGSYKGGIGGNTFVELTNGFVVNVYGGSRQADIQGAAHVWAYDGSTRSAVTGIAADGSNRLIICNLYGGNDISGTIHGTMPATWSEDVWTELRGRTFHSYVQVAGTDPGEHGFPLVGSLYGGGNGELWREELGAAPDVERALIEIDGGTTLRAFGGGNRSTVTDSAFIFVNAASAQFANVLFDEYQKGILNKTFFQGTHGGYRWDGTRLIMEPHHVGGLFGGNNVADMYIQPTWNLLHGKLGAVYSGGNKGRMTHTPGIEIDVVSDDIAIGNLFGGCRMADVTGSATVNVSAGRIGNVFGGNDVAGNITGGVNVNVTGGVAGNVYGAGNGDYLYRYRYHTDSIGQIVEQKEQTIGGVPYDLYFDVYGDVARASAADKLHYINENVRPNVAQSTINISGASESQMTYVTGSIFCGGNAATIRKVKSSFMHFNIGSNTVLNNVFLGSNGEELTNTDKVTKFAALNGFSFNTNALLHDYMAAVDMEGLPDDFTINPTITNAYIGTFCLGGNRGSMITTDPISLTFPESITIYDKVIGGCNKAYFSYEGYSFTGGMTGWNTDRSLPKIKLDIYSQFVPKKLRVNEGVYTLVDPIENNLLTDKYCNVYGGCYTRGFVNGDVEINMYSDMIGSFNQTVLANNIAYNETNARPVFSIFGGGFGANTVIYGNTHIRLLNKGGASHPSVNAIYGGGEQGKMVGTSTIHIADGTVYSNVVGGALNGSIYGNTEILVGYPSYYEVQKTGEYKLKRSNFTSEELAKVDGNGNPAIKQSIFLTVGDRINAAVYQAIVDWDTEKHTTQADALVLTQNKVAHDWDDINITIKGGIYGGGYARENVEDGQTALANTVLKFTGTYNLATAHPEFWTAENTLSGQAIDMQGEYDYGGNATIWVQDAINAQNFTSFDKQKKEHITITTETDPVAHTGVGGIFGDGHSSLVAAFRSAAVEGYGYAEHPANAPKLLNTFQRFDVLQIRDCAMKMYGQVDVATGQNDPTLYSVSRISELMLNSNINADAQDLLATSNLNARNVIDFYNPVHFLGSITSEVTFKPLAQGGSKYHDKSGNVTAQSYYDYKSTLIAQNYDYVNHTIISGDSHKEAFARRNAGTAKNLIRINDPEGRGVHLKVVQENNYTINPQGVREEQSFYGPLSGVFEFELMHANARGGGYVYSNNPHNQTIRESGVTTEGVDLNKPSFLQTSGNIFFVPVTIDQDKTRQVYDDCYPNPYPGKTKLDDAHYWFVEGDGPTWCTYAQEFTAVDVPNNTITITSAEELAYIYTYIDLGYDSEKEGSQTYEKYPAGFAGWTIQLGNDIDLGQLTILDQREVRMIWCPIADVKGAAFKGTFDGKGHKIDGMLLDVDYITTKNTYGNENYSEDYDHYFGLFAKTEGATIQNVELSDAMVLNYNDLTGELVHIGTLIAQVNGTTVQDCSVQVTDSITTNQSNAVAAAAAFICHTNGAASTIHRNFVSGKMEANSTAVTAPVSGFISTLGHGSTMEHCYSLVDVHAQQVAGLANTIDGATLEHSYYAGTLTRTNDATQWGAILANATNATVKHCYYDATKNPVAKGYQGVDTHVFSSKATKYTSWSTYGLTTAEMTDAESGHVWRSCYSHGHDAAEEAEESRCEIDAEDGKTEPHATAWNKGRWTFLPGLYPILKKQELDCSALTTAFHMPTAASLGLTGWDDINRNFKLPTYGQMYWTVANNTLLLEPAVNDQINAHLYLGGPDALTLNCDEYIRWMQEIYVTREDINSPDDADWYSHLSDDAKSGMATQLHADNFTLGMLRNKEVTNISKKNAGVYEENGFDGDLHIWNREGSAGSVTNPRQYTVNGTIAYYTGYENPYLWHEVNIPFEVRSTNGVTVYRRFQAAGEKEYPIAARTADLAVADDGGNFWLRSFGESEEILYGGSTFQQAWEDPVEDENYGHRPSVIRFPKTMVITNQDEKTTYLSGDYWCYAQENTIDGTEYHNGGSEIRFYSTATGNTLYGTGDWDGHADMRGADNNFSFRVYGNPTLGKIQLEGYYWTLEAAKRDTAGVSDPNVKPEVNTRVAQWFSLQQDPVILPFGIWLDGPQNFKDQAMGENSNTQLRITPLHEPGTTTEMFGDGEATFTATGYDGILGVFSYIDQDIHIYDPKGALLFTTPVRANTGFTLDLPNMLFLVCGSQSPKQVKVVL